MARAPRVGTFFGTTQSLMDVQQLYPRTGRFLTNSDDESRRRVVVLGEQIRKDLDLPENPEGEFVQIGREWFKVIGVMESRGMIFGQNLDMFMLMPYETALTMGSREVRPDIQITFVVDNPDLVEVVKQQVASVIRRAHGIEKDKPDDFRVQSSDSFLKTFAQIMATITAVVAGIVGISLLVGGIGIMNIMLVSVTERTREIGIAKALGAPRRFILLQFLIEAMVLAVIGGIIGCMLIGFGLAYGLSALIPNFPPPSVPWWAVVGSCLFSMLIGMVFGIPAGQQGRQPRAHRRAALRIAEAARRPPLNRPSRYLHAADRGYLRQRCAGFPLWLRASIIHALHSRRSVSMPVVTATSEQIRSLLKNASIEMTCKGHRGTARSCDAGAEGHGHLHRAVPEPDLGRPYRRGQGRERSRLQCRAACAGASHQGCR